MSTPLFSERLGYVIRPLQVEAINGRTRNRLWNILKENVLHPIASEAYERLGNYSPNEMVRGRNRAFGFLRSIHERYFGYLNEYFPESETAFIDTCRNYLLVNDWYNCFDFIEVIVATALKIYEKGSKYPSLISIIEGDLNWVLEEEKCMYRLVNGLIVPITNEAELIAIRDAIEETESITIVNQHLMQAVKLFADRTAPDYRNAIKEAISALESLVKLIAGTTKGTLADALDLIKRNGTIGLHPALQKSLTTLYGWAGDEEGVRHGQKNESLLDSDDAKLIIVTCCSMTTYLLARAVKSGINLAGNKESK